MYCGWKGCRRQNRIVIQNCIVTGGPLGAGAGRAGAGRWCAARAGALQAGERSGRAAGGAWGARKERQVCGRAERCDTAEGPGHDTARRVRPGPARPVLVLMHLAQFSTWFFDSVFFLSH